MATVNLNLEILNLPLEAVVAGDQPDESWIVDSMGNYLLAVVVEDSEGSCLAPHDAHLAAAEIVGAVNYCGRVFGLLPAEGKPIE